MRIWDDSPIDNRGRDQCKKKCAIALSELIDHMFLLTCSLSALKANTRFGKKRRDF